MKAMLFLSYRDMSITITMSTTTTIITTTIISHKTCTEKSTEWTIYLANAVFQFLPREKEIITTRSALYLRFIQLRGLYFVFFIGSLYVYSWFIIKGFCISNLKPLPVLSYYVILYNLRYIFIFLEETFITR